MTKTDRELWADTPNGVFAYSLMMGGAAEDFTAGLRGFAAAWFATWEDEQNLPAWFAQAIKDAEEIGLDLGVLPSDEDEDEYVDEDAFRGDR